jgi:hypothetical protein
MSNDAIYRNSVPQCGVPLVPLPVVLAVADLRRKRTRRGMAVIQLVLLLAIAALLLMGLRRAGNSAVSKISRTMAVAVLPRESTPSGKGDDNLLDPEAAVDQHKYGRPGNTTDPDGADVSANGNGETNGSDDGPITSTNDDQSPGEMVLAAARDIAANHQDKYITPPGGRAQCSTYVNDVLCASIGCMPIWARYWPITNPYPPVAGDFADKDLVLPGLEVVDGPPQPGDVLAIAEFYLDASGHVGIVVDGGHTLSVNTNLGRPVVSDWGFRPGQNPTIRRPVK